MEMMACHNSLRHTHRGCRHRRGATLVLSVIVLVVLLGISALAIDLGVAFLAAAQARNVADAAALAGAGKWRDAFDVTAAKNEAARVAAANTVLDDAQVVSPNTDVVFGSWDEASGTVVPWDETIGVFAIQVTVRRTSGSANGPVPTFFAKIWDRDSINVTRTAVAGLHVVKQSRLPVQMMIVQDGSTSFQEAWSEAIDADTELVKLINSVSVKDDAAGIVTFNAELPESWMRSNRPAYGEPTYYDLYRPYPQMNNGIKYTTDARGKPLKTNAQGIPDAYGQVRSMACDPVLFNPETPNNLPQVLTNMSKLVNNGNAWGDTDTAAGLNYAIDRLLNMPSANVEKVILLVSDGKPHDVRGTYYTYLREQAAIAAANRAQANGIRIHTVTLEGTKGADYEFNEGLVRNGGVALRAADAGHLHDLIIGVGTIEVGSPRLLK